MITLTLPKQGETLIFFSPPDCDAPSVAFEMHLAPGGKGPTPHSHPKQSEHFEVVSGCLIATRNGTAHRVEAGGAVLIDAGVVHSFANGSDTEEVVCRCTATPALNLQWFLTELAGAANRGGGRWDDASLLEVGYALHQMQGEYQLAGMPPFLQTLLASGLASAAQLLGRTKHISPKPVGNRHSSRRSIAS